jgi:hypothetical protein
MTVEEIRTSAWRQAMQERIDTAVARENRQRRTRRALRWLQIGAYLAALVAIVVSLVGCPKPPTPDPVRPDADGGGPASCVSVCRNVERLGCLTSSRCARDCERLRSQDLKDCIARASSCYEADQCDL